MVIGNMFLRPALALQASKLERVARATARLCRLFLRPYGGKRPEAERRRSQEGQAFIIS